jgi:hypothetical protein
MIDEPIETNVAKVAYVKYEEPRQKARMAAKRAPS